MDTERMIQELRIEAERHKNDRLFTGQLNISIMCREVANRMEELYNKTKWHPINGPEDLPPKDKYDWVLVRVKMDPEGWYGVPHIAELRNGEWWAMDCEDGPMEEWLHVKVTDWMPLPGSDERKTVIERIRR